MSESERKLHATRKGKVNQSRNPGRFPTAQRAERRVLALTCSVLPLNVEGLRSCEESEEMGGVRVGC